jgi:hypothetical protein
MDEKVNDTLTGGPKQNTRDKRASGAAPRGGAGSTRGPDDIMNSAITGKNKQRPGINPEPERKGNIYDPEHPDTRQSPRLDGSQDAQ